MNWLAHLYLSPADAEFRVGNVIADWVKGEQRKSFSPAVRRGIACHVEIDRFTDTHPIVARSHARLEPPYRRFAGVLVDVFYDYVLATDWPRYSAVSFDEFKRDVYSSFASVWDALDSRIRQGLQRMVQDDWLGSYASVAGIDAILKRMARRLSRPTPIGEAAPQLVLHETALREDFAAYFPLLVAHIEAWRRDKQLGAAGELH